MRLLDRYLLRELIIPLVYCISGFLLIWVVADLINELGNLQEHKLKAGDIALYYLVQAPGFLVLGLPIALLLALLYALTNHSRHNELTAIRAAGVSLWRLALPYFGVGFIASLALLVLNETYVPGSAARAEQIKNLHVPQAPDGPGRGKVANLVFSNARDNRDWHIGMYDLQTGEMLKPGPVISNGGPGPSRWLYADRGVRLK